MGITFTLYSEGASIDRSWPMDLIPRIITASEWARVSAGLIQRMAALNAFIDDLYHEQRVVDSGVFPAALLEDSVNFRPECRGVDVAGGIWAHICGSDLVRDGDGDGIEDCVDRSVTLARHDWAQQIEVYDGVLAWWWPMFGLVLSAALAALGVYLTFFYDP